jgi:hypothetical protein
MKCVDFNKSKHVNILEIMSLQEIWKSMTENAIHL